MITRVIKHPKFLLYYLDRLNIIHINDEKYIRLLYEIQLGKKINLENPKTFCEKLQWLKLHNKQDYFTKLVDKYEAKEYVKKIIGEQYIIPTIGIYNNFDEIDFEKLPNQFVMKCTHDSGGLVICEDKSKLNIKEARKIINKCLKRNYFYSGREYPYKNVKPRIIIEKFMKDDNTKSMRDYKFFCFDGTPYVMYLSEGLGSHVDAGMSFFDMDFNLRDITRSDYPPLKEIPNKPKKFEEMKELAKILSKNISHVRVDFYEINGQVYFGEMTFFTASGFIPFTDEKWDLELGEKIKI